MKKGKEQIIVPSIAFVVIAVFIWLMSSQSTFLWRLMESIIMGLIVAIAVWTRYYAIKKMEALFLSAVVLILTASITYFILGTISIYFSYSIPHYLLSACFGLIGAGAMYVMYYYFLDD